MSNYYHDLAFAYIHGLLPHEQKGLVFQLINTESLFREALRQELALAQQLQALHCKAPAGIRERVRETVLEKNVNKFDALQVIEVVLNPILQASLPEVAWLAIKRCQERVYFSG